MLYIDEAESGSPATKRRRIAANIARLLELLKRDEFPYQIPTGNLYDSGNYPGALEYGAADARLRCVAR